MQATNGPELSVVVPIYNVERYLDECLASVAAQHVQDFECILVNDGSTDHSAEIAARWCESDPRFRLVHQSNHGLGHARNTGTGHVTGTYLAFLDSDDIAPPDAYRTMIESLDETGSDFATGNVHRYNSTGQSWQAPLYGWTPKLREQRTHVSRRPELLRDHLAHNKVWRTSFWRDSKSEFPVGVLYEDVPATIPAHVRAKAVDFVPVVAVLWRVRDQGDFSITQSRNHDASHIRDRVDGMLTASQFIGEHAGQDLKNEYDFLVMRRDLRWYIDLYPQVDNQYREELFASIRRFVGQVSPQALRRVPVDLRPAYSLVETDAHDDFAAFVEMRLSGQVNQWPTVVRGSRAVVELALPHGTQLPDHALDVTEQIDVISKVSSLEVTASEIVITGWAYLSQIEVEDSQQIKVWLTADGHVASADVTYHRDMRAAVDAGAVAEATGRLAFTARVPIKSLNRRSMRRGLSWRVMMAVVNAGIERTSQVQGALPGMPERPIVRKLKGDRWLRLSWSDEGLTCRIRVESALLADVATSGSAFGLTLHTSSRVRSDAQLRVRSSDGASGRSFPVTRYTADSKRAHVLIPVTELPGFAPDDRTPSDDTPFLWDVLFKASKSGAWQRVQDVGMSRDGALVVNDMEVVVRRSRGATVGLAAGPIAPLLTSVTWSESRELSLTLTYASTTPLNSIVLRSRRRNDEVVFPAVATGSVVTATMPVFALTRFGENAPLRAGTWELYGRFGSTTVPIRIGRTALDSLPSTATGPENEQATLTDSRRQSLCLIMEDDLRAEERGAANQSRLRTKVYPQSKSVIRDAVLYQENFGKTFADSPRRIFNELRSSNADLEHLVVVRSRQFKVPQGATAVPYRSARYYEALAQSRFIVANTHLPAFFERAEGQSVLQTWHGVRLDSPIFVDDHSANGSSSYADQWTHLVSPNPYTSPFLKDKFAFNGYLLETGSPRNDIFYQTGQSDLPTQIKSRLGLSKHQSVVLYAPTARSAQDDTPDAYHISLRLDLHKVAERLGDDFITLFYKHPKMSGRLRCDSEKVVDVSDWPDMQKLLLITDVLVTDYSHLASDFANTGRPIIFHVDGKDVEHESPARDALFDLKRDAPGPLIKDESDLLRTIVDAEKIRVEYEAQYQAFLKRFCSWDDGDATGRVTRAVFGAWI